MAYYALGRRAESDAALAQVVREHAESQAWEIADVYAYVAKWTKRLRGLIVLTVKGTPHCT